MRVNARVRHLTVGEEDERRRATRHSTEVLVGWCDSRWDGRSYDAADALALLDRNCEDFEDEHCAARAKTPPLAASRQHSPAVSARQRRADLELPLVVDLRENDTQGGRSCLGSAARRALRRLTPARRDSVVKGARFFAFPGTKRPLFR